MLSPIRVPARRTLGRCLYRAMPVLSMEGIPPLKAKLTKAEKKAKYRTDFVEPIKSRRESLKAIMNGPENERERKARSKNREYFEEDYKSGVNIYGMAVDMMKAMPDRGKTSGQSLAAWYLEEFGKWLKSTGEEETLREKYLETTIKMNALQACTLGQETLLSEVFDISKDQLIQDIALSLDSYIKKQDFNNAADLAITHDLIKEKHFEEIVLPLILRGNERKAFLLMRKNINMQKRLVEFLDNMVGIPIVRVEEIMKPYEDRKIKTISTDRFIGKSLEKLISTVIKSTEEFGFCKDLAKTAKNYSLNSNLKAMKYHISERYDAQASDENYFQHMTDTFNQVEDSREPTLFYLWDSNNTEKQIDAICFALYLEINSPNSKYLPGKMKDFFRQPDSRLQSAKDLLEKRKQQQVPQSNELMYVFEKEKQYPIRMVKNESEMNFLCSELKSLDRELDPVYVGFDSEWKPSNLTVYASKIAIIQLFFKKTVWLVDCVELEKENIREEWWERFSTRLFGNSKLKIIGFDMRNDLEAMIGIPALKYALKVEEIENSYDLKKLAENVCDIDMEILELPKKTFKLADLTQHFLKLTLDKTEQCSNWQCRPLRKNQIIYAATDAVVVVECYKKIVEIVIEKGKTPDIKKLIAESNVMAPKKERGQKSYKKLKATPWLEIYQVLRHHRDSKKPLQRPQDIKVIVDTMLLGFGKHLRRIGVDVYLPKDVSDFRDKLKLMSRLGSEYRRHIITIPSKSYEALKAEYECYTYAIPELNTMSPIDQLVAFFDVFNIEIYPQDVYTRCIECNSELQIKFPGPVLHFLHQYCVIHVQNIYRDDMSDFPIEDWWKRMLQINPDDYDGIHVEMTRPKPNSDWIVATVPTGCLHITRQTAIHNNLPEGVEVRIHKVPDDEFQRPNLCFYVCGECGTVACDGRGLPSSASNSHESVQ